MRRNWKYKALIAVAIAALLAGGLSAILRTGHHHNPASTHTRAGNAHLRRGGDLTVAADYLGVTRTQLRRELQVHHTLGQVADATKGRSATALVAALASAKAAKLRTAVADGRITPAKEKTAVATAHARAAAAVERPHDLATAKGEMAIAASYLGVSSAQLRRERQAGRSLAEQANARAGKSASGLIDAIVERKSELTAAAASSALSPARKQMLLSQLRRRVTAAVDRMPAKPPAQ